MNVLHSILKIWIFIDIMRYIRYCVLLSRLNKWKRPISQHHTNIRKCLSDLIHYPQLTEKMFEDFFYGNHKLENIMHSELYDSMCRLYCEKKEYTKKIKNIIQKSKEYFEKMGRNILVGTKPINRIKAYHEKLDSWFCPLPIFLIKMIYYALFCMYMYRSGYRQTILKDGIKIWDNGYDTSKGTPLLFFHCSIGGASLYVSMLKYLSGTKNMIIVEYPGLSFYYFEDMPPTIDQMVHQIIEFIRLSYRIEKINIMGHSAGSIICNHIINSNPEMVENYFCIEGSLTFYRTLTMYDDLRRGVLDQPISYIMTMPLFQRNIYVQFFIKRLICYDSFVYDLNNTRSHIQIHLFHAKHDKRINIMAQIEYAKLKRIPLKYYIFTDEHMDHGSFILNEKFRTNTLKEIDNVYKLSDNI